MNCTMKSIIQSEQATIIEQSKRIKCSERTSPGESKKTAVKAKYRSMLFYAWQSIARIYCCVIVRSCFFICSRFSNTSPKKQSVRQPDVGEWDIVCTAWKKNFHVFLVSRCGNTQTETVPKINAKNFCCLKQSGR